ncbi:class I SAM-dependent DNA methyltransferase [candidate division KSB1 bacterium]
MNEKESVKYFDEFSADWDKDQVRVKRSEEIADKLVFLLPLEPEMEILDFGGGTGNVTLKLVPHVKKITMIDTSEGMIDIFRNKLKEQNINNVELKAMDAQEEEIGDYIYDIIVSTMTFHHVKNLPLVLERLYRSLKDSGRIAVVDLVKESGDYHGTGSAVEHHGFNKETMIDLFRKAGFKEIDHSIIYTVNKTTENGKNKDFPLFLVSAEK